MAPDSHTNLPDATDAAAADDVSVTITSPSPDGILFKGNKPKKRVTFRDSNLVNIREIPPRSRSRSSSYDEESEDEDEDDSCSSDSDEGSDSDSGDEEEARKGPATVNRKDKAATVSRTSPSSPVPTITAASSGPRLRPERAPIPWSSVPNLTVAKGSYEVASSPASKVVSLVSQITGVSVAAAQAHLKQRAASAAASASAPKPAASPPPPKKQPSVVRVEKKVKKITPTLDNVITSQTVRSVQKHGTVSESLNKGSGSGKPAKKKRVLHRRPDGSDKRKASSSSSRKARDVKVTTCSKVNGATSPWPGKASGRAVNGLSGVRDSLSLPPLGGDDSALLQSSRALQHMSLAKSTVYTLDGFIFPGDPTHDLAAGVKAASAAAGAEEGRIKPVVPAATPITGTPVPRERISSAPPSSPSRRRRYYAWQMANGNLQSSLHDSPCITPMWETVQPVTSVTAKSASPAGADR